MTLIIALLLAVCLPHEPSLGKKPPKPPPEPPTPPVLYEIDFFEPPHGSGGIVAKDMNNAGCVVGWYSNTATNGGHGFVYDYVEDYNPDLGIGMARDLNDIVYDPDWPIPEGFRISAADAINDSGAIVGALRPNDGSDTRLGCVINMNATLPQLVLIDPDWEPGNYMVASSINSDGDIVGSQDIAGKDRAFVSFPELGYSPIDLGLDPVSAEVRINDSREIAGRFVTGDERHLVFSAFRYQLGVTNGEVTVEGGVLGGLISDRRLTAKDINNNGVVLGRATTPVGKGKKTTLAAYRYGTAPDPVFNDEGYSPGTPMRMNDTGDFVALYYMYFEGFGYFHPDELIDPLDGDFDDWITHVGCSVYVLNNRTGDGEFGQIAGRIFFDGGLSFGFVLTPTD